MTSIVIFLSVSSAPGATDPAYCVQDNKVSGAQIDMQRQVKHYKEKLRRTCVKLTEVLALYHEASTQRYVLAYL